MTRVALLHTGAVVIGPISGQAREALPDVEIVNYLDDRIVSDLGDPERAASVAGRLVDLARAARAGGADAVMLTCSSISHLAAPTAEAAGLPVLRIDEAMADAAVRGGARITVLATLPTTLVPTAALLRERAALAGAAVELTEEVIDGAFGAGDREMHDRLIVAAIERHADDADVIVLAQASMASAAAGARTDVPVLSSIAPGIARLRDFLAGAGS